jgi:flagellar protein FlaG
MEANMVLQTGVLNVGANRPRIDSPAAASSPVPNVQPTPAAVPQMPDTAIAPSAGMLNSHVTSAQRVEDLATFSVPIREEEISEATISRVVDAANEALAPSFFRLNFDIHEQTNLVVVQVIDTNTEEILREVPPESRLDIVAKIQESAGLLFDEVS